MFSAIALVFGILAVSADASIGYYGYPGFYSAPYAANPWQYRTQFHTQANYAPVAYAYNAPAVTYAAAPAVTYAAPAAAYSYKTYADAYPAYSNQYHSQNHLGEAAYGYSFPGQAHSAVRDAFGGVSGSYSYIGADGKPVAVNYRADAANGFQVSSNVLPVAPKVNLVQPANTLVGPEPVDFTPEVKAARDLHFKALEGAKARSAPESSEPEYTPEVKAAREEHFKAVEAAKAATLSRKKRQVAFPYATPYAYHAAPYAYHAAPYAYNAAPYAYNAAPAFYSAPLAAYNPYAFHAAPAAVVKTEIKPLKAVEGTPASTYKFELE